MGIVSNRQACSFHIQHDDYCAYCRESWHRNYPQMHPEIRYRQAQEQQMHQMQHMASMPSFMDQGIPLGWPIASSSRDTVSRILRPKSRKLLLLL